MSGHTPEGSPGSPAIARIVITGFMGAGKTTVGALLAQRLGWEFADSDFLVERRAGKTIAAIFATEGESAFRDLEAAAIKELVTATRRIVALGGGALERPQTRSLLASLPDALIVFLDAPLEMLVARCSGQAGAPVRPILADRARLEERWSARLPWYRQAHLTVNTAEGSPESVVERILDELRNRRPGLIDDTAAAAAAPTTEVSA